MRSAEAVAIVGVTQLQGCVDLLSVSTAHFLCQMVISDEAVTISFLMIVTKISSFLTVLYGTGRIKSDNYTNLQLITRECTYVQM